ncbi:MAG: stage III sporulation protein AB [Roseburia sp.]|nr:stage III sporulation protein AB [Roseburia sp.]MCM1098328.1 stage III sporulation protein AB [Ruminococcus flavefaciens]
MLKALGGCMIVSGCLGLGVWYRDQFQGRIRSLRLLQTILELLCGEIRYGRAVLGECCGRTAERISSPCREAFRRIADRMRENTGEDFETVFREYMGEALEAMPLTEEDREVFFGFVPKSGFPDGQMQIRMIEQSRERLARRAEELERENAGKCRMALGLGAMSGLLILLVLC